MRATPNQTFALYRWSRRSEWQDLAKNEQLEKTDASELIKMFIDHKNGIVSDTDPENRVRVFIPDFKIKGIDKRKPPPGTGQSQNRYR